MPARQESCCFTGHRPAKLPWGYNERDPRCVRLKERIADAVLLAYQEGYRHFLCGMAQGCDLYFCEAVLALRRQHSDAALEAARPCETQSNSWPAGDRRRYQAILDQCDLETLVQHHYDRGCMMRRNRYMVDRSSQIIAVYDGVPKGGTAQTLAYAMRRGLKTEILSLCQEESI